MSNISTPLTPSQRHIWQSQIISPDKPLFNQIITARLNPQSFSASQAGALCDAWLRVQQQHPVLTSTIVSDDRLHPLQHYHPRLHPMEQVSLRTMDADASASTEDWISDRGARLFTLEEKLHDVVLLHLGDGGFMLYLNMHHLIADAISTQLVLQALMTEFEAGQSGDTTSGPASCQFHEYAQALAGQMRANECADPAALAHAGGSGATSQAGSAVFYDVINSEPTTVSARQTIALSIEQRQSFVTLAREPALRQLNDNLSLMCLHATALVLYLHKATSDEHIVIQAPLSGRFEPRLKRLTGNLIEMVKLEIVVEPSLSLLQLHQRVRDQLFHVLGKASAGCTHELTPGPVHGVLNMITRDSTLDSATLQDIQWHHPGHSDTHHPLRLHVSDWNNTALPVIEADFNQGFFPGVRTRRACEHLATAYCALLASRDTQLKAVSLPGADEQWRFHGALPDSAPGSDFRSLIDRITLHCRERPETIAVCDDAGGELDYRALETGMTNVCRGLADIGVGRHQRVAVLMRRSLRLPAVLLGILRSGAAYIPVDPDQPDARIAQIIEEAQAGCVIVDDVQPRDHPPQWPFDHGKLITAQALLAGDSAASVTPHSAKTDAATQEALDKSKPTLQGGDTAYIIFTSGSTGKPKGVVVSHTALMAYLNWACDYYALQEPVAMPLHTSIGFDMTVTSLFLPLLSGGMIKVFGESDTRNGSNVLALFAAISDTQVNTVKLTPSHLALLNDAIVPAANIRQLIVGGEDLKSSIARDTVSRFGQNIRLINEYGPSEATVGCIVHQWDSGCQRASVPIGLPISGTSAYVLDENAQPQFEGAVGELYLSGHSLADGYWRNPEQTAAAFVESPWVPGERLYRTGDLVRVDEGQLHYLGRSDTQIKRNGYRIELAEVEAIIATHPKVTDCVAAFETTPAAAVRDDSVSAGLTMENHCSRCGLSSLHPDGTLDADGLCTLCASFLPNQDRVNKYFRNIDELNELVRHIQCQRRGEYDALVLLSGGKDSTYALARLVDMGLKVYAFSLDNGFISDQAKENIDMVCERLGVDHHYATTPHMNDIFVDSLTRYSNVCHGCFKTIYTLSLQFAEMHGIDYIFTGLSRGQLFETRLNNELFSDRTLPLSRIDDMVQAARVQYHAVQDAPNRLLNVEKVNCGLLPEKIAIVDFYRYCHVELADMIHYLSSRVGWVRPADTGRSTNCLINDVGIHVHKLEQGFHNYSLPYSWDVRLGHKRRDEALQELDDDIDTERVDQILRTIGYTPVQPDSKPDALCVYVKGAESLSVSDLAEWMDQALPDYMRPGVISLVKHLPLNANGKIDRNRLVFTGSPDLATRTVEALEPEEARIATVWQQFTSTEPTSPMDDFFRLGGDSLSAIRCVVRLRELGYSVEPAVLFRTPRLKDFARLVTTQYKPESEKTRGHQRSFSALDATQREKLQRLLARKSKSSGS